MYTIKLVTSLEVSCSLPNPTKQNVQACPILGVVLLIKIPNKQKF